MNNSIFNELKYKVFQSGNPVFLYIGINVSVFIIIGLTSLISAVFSGADSMHVINWVGKYLGLNASIAEFLWKFYTLVTYMFIHTNMLHLIFNMLWLYWIGNILFDLLPKRNFHFMYWGGGLSTGVLFLLVSNLIPYFAPKLGGTMILIGASGAIMAVIVATATLTPNYMINMMFFGGVQLKYLALGYILLDILSLIRENPGGSIAHLGGGLFGFLSIKSLQSGNNWLKPYSLRPKMRIKKNNQFYEMKSPGTQKPDQAEIDKVLDKVLESGYKNLTKAEKEILSRASKND